MQPLEIARQIYGLKVDAVIPVAGGLTNQIWKLVAHGQNFVLRRHSASTTMQTIEAELAWLDELSRPPCARTPKPVRPCVGDLTAFIEHDTVGTLIARWTALEWIPGAPRGRLLTSEEAFAVGSLLADLHRRASAWVAPTGLEWPVYDRPYFEAAIQELLTNTHIHLAPEMLSKLIDAGIEPLATLDALMTSSCTCGIIHADVHDGNILWEDKASEPYLIDFDRAGLGSFALDVAMAQHYQVPPQQEALLEGYEAERGEPLTGRNQLAQLRWLAAVENLSILSRYSEEMIFVLSELPALV
jgi:Ser/Thr protein kinase RdoA (MazF antagonist)